MSEKMYSARIIWGTAACLLLAFSSSPTIAAASSYTPGEIARDANGEPVMLAQADVSSRTVAPGDTVGAIKDPFENYNRAIFKFNNGADRYFLKPIAKAYRWVLPGFVRRGITNGFNNLQEPFTFVNALLQGKGDLALKSLGRFLINSTVGIAGLNDQASQWDVKRQEEDFGQTLGVWGVGDGPFLMLPFLGPSNPRDLVGFVAEALGSPSNVVFSRAVANSIDYSLTAVELVDLRARALDSVDKLLETSTDPYVALRSAYIQQRRFQVKDGESSITIPTDDEFFDESSSPEAPQAESQPQAQADTDVQPEETAQSEATADSVYFNPEMHSACISE